MVAIGVEEEEVELDEDDDEEVVLEVGVVEGAVTSGGGNMGSKGASVGTLGRSGKSGTGIGIGIGIGIGQPESSSSSDGVEEEGGLDVVWSPPEDVGADKVGSPLEEPEPVELVNVVLEAPVMRYDDVPVVTEVPEVDVQASTPVDVHD